MTTPSIWMWMDTVSKRRSESLAGVRTAPLLRSFKEARSRSCDDVSSRVEDDSIALRFHDGPLPSPRDTYLDSRVCAPVDRATAIGDYYCTAASPHSLNGDPSTTRHCEQHTNVPAYRKLIHESDKPLQKNHYKKNQYKKNHYKKPHQHNKQPQKQ